MIRLACTDNTFRLVEPWESAIDMIRLLELEAVDVCVMGNRSHLRPGELRQDIPSLAKRVTRTLQERELAISDVFAIPCTDFETLCPNHPSERERERSREFCVQLLELCALTGSPGLTMLPGIDWVEESHEDSLQRSIDELGWRAEQAGMRGVAFSIEPHVGSIVQDPQQAKRLCEAAPGVRLTLDYSHLVYQGYEQPEVESLVPHARHFHARGARPGRLQSALKDSTIDFELMIDSMLRAGYDGDISLEYLWIDWEHLNECDTVSETILLRDRLRAKLADELWTYPASAI